MTNNDITIHNLYIKARIMKLKTKALKRLKMTKEEKEINRLIYKLKNDPEFQKIYIILLLASIKD